jgi:hypothetical protein
MNGKTKSQVLIENNLKRSLRIIDLKTFKGLSRKPQKDLKSLESTAGRTVSRGSNSKNSRSCKSSFSLTRKITETPEDFSNQIEERQEKHEKFERHQRIAEKEKILNEKEAAFKELEKKTRKIEKEVKKKEREAEIYTSACNRMIAESLSKGIIEDLIWEVMFRSLKKEQLSIISRKNACLTALAKMKKAVKQIETMKRSMEKQALLFISSKHTNNVK